MVEKETHLHGMFSNSAIEVFFLLIALSIGMHAQERITIQANARGTMTQSGQMVPVKIIIEDLSTAEDQQLLVDAFNRSGNDGLLKALGKMKPKGRVSPERSVGNDVKYIREIPSDKGRRFRLVTDRNLAFAELRNSTRSVDYNVGAIEVTITPDEKSSFGTLLPACKLKLNKDKEVEIEAYQFPWDITNVIVHTDKK